MDLRTAATVYGVSSSMLTYRLQVSGATTNGRANRSTRDKPIGIWRLHIGQK